MEIPGEIQLPSYTAKRSHDRPHAQSSDAIAMIFGDDADQQWR
jgi:hypothetical protein